MAIYSGFSHEKRWFSIAMLNYQRVLQNVTPATSQCKPSGHFLGPKGPNLINKRCSIPDQDQRPNMSSPNPHRFRVVFKVVSSEPPCWRWSARAVYQAASSVFEPPANTSLQSLQMTKIEAWHQRNPQEHMGTCKRCVFPFVPHVFNSSCSSQVNLDGPCRASTPHFPTTSAGGDAPSSRPLTSFTSAMQRWGRSMELDATRA